ncbi:MAG: chromosome segregation ATPase [Clostridium sp.]
MHLLFHTYLLYDIIIAKDLGGEFMDKEILDILKVMQNDMKLMQGDMKSMKGDIKSMQGDMKSMQGDIKSMQSDMISVKITQEEHTQILRALEHKTDVISAQQESLNHEFAEIKGEVKSIRKDMSSVEIITANNWSDIAKLKAIK